MSSESSNFVPTMTIKDYHKAAIITPDHEVSYTELMQYIRVYADVLKRALASQTIPEQKGGTAKAEKKKVLIFSENREEWVYAFYAIWLCDAIVITVDATSTVSDVAYIMRDSGADAVWVSPGTEAVARQALSETGQQMVVLSIEEDRKMIDDGGRMRDESLLGESVKRPLAASLRFGHEVVVMPTVCFLNLNGYGEQYADLEDLAANGWHDNRIFPMGSNIQMVFYSGELDKPILVKILLNEEETVMPQLTPVEGCYYKWQDVKDYCQKKLATFGE